VICGRLFMLEGVDGPEPAGLQKRFGDVVGEVAEAEGGAAEVFEAAVESPMFVKSG
jgi:hypothetical protein